jgi:FMN phosphatase YigB (HAD superfamily)
MHKLRTVDVWDTLLRRHCHPEAVKLSTAQHIFLRFHSSHAPAITDHWQIHAKRNAIEAALAREAEAASHDGEYDLLTVLERLLQEILRNASDENIAQIAAQAAEYELAFEMSVTFKDPDIANFLADYPAEKTVYLSDFYMGSTMLDRLLAHHGLNDIVPDGLVSSDIKLNKRSGRLFRHVQNMHAVSSAEHIHIGDNPYADVETPRRLGITAISYVPHQSHAERGAREATFASRNALFAHLHAATRRTAEDIAGTLAPEEAAAFHVGLQAAPLFVGFALFIAERAIIDKPDHLFFFTREGEFFHRLNSALFPDGVHAGHKLPDSSVLCVSRQATFAASLDAVTIDELKRVWSLNSQQKTQTLFNILDIDPAGFSDVLVGLGLSLDELIVKPDHDTRIKALFDNPQFASAARISAESKRQLLAAYLAQNGAEPGKKLGLVDIGWRGTIQDNIARVLPGCETFGYYLALRTFLNKQPANTAKFAFGPDERKEKDMDFFETFEPLELLCNSAFGSVSGYKMEGGKVVPVREINDQENSVIERFTRHFQNGVVAAATIQRPIIRNHAVLSFEMRDAALRVWKELASRPPKQLIEAYYAAPQHDVFGFGGFFDRGQAPSIGMLCQALFRRKQREMVIQYVRRTQWVSALDGLKIGFANRMALGAVFWLAHRYKRLQMKRVGR